MHYAIRTATRQDIAAVDALLARAYPRLLKADYPPSIWVTALPLISRAQPQLVTSGTYYVAEAEGGAILGAGGWTAAVRGAERGAPGRANVRHLVTDDRALRQGIGRAILSRCFDRARNAGMTWMHCTATRTAVPFYLALGFSVIRPVSLPLAPGIDFPAVEMRRDL